MRGILIPPSDLRRRAVAGVVWNIGSQGGQQVLQFVLMLVLARLLRPADFGLVGMVTVFTGFAMLFADLGLGAALVERSELRDAHLDTAFWLNVAFGILLAAGFVLGAPAIAALYDEPALVAIVRVSSVSFIITALTVVQRSVLQRELDFRPIVIVSVLGQLAGGAVAVGIALAGGGVWSLVAHPLVASSVTSAGLWWHGNWHPSLRVERASLNDLWSFGANLTGFNALNYWVRNADDFLIGRYVGAGPLGLYSRSYAVMLLPLRRVSGAIGQVMFPALARISGDVDRSRRIYLKAIGVISMVTFPMMLGLLVVADEFVLGVLGHQWRDAIPILRVFCLVGVLQSVGTTTGWLYQSQGRTDWMFRWGLASGAVTIIAFLAGLPWGALGVAIAYAIRTFGLTYFNFVIPGRLINMSFRDVMRATVWPLVLSTGMAACVAAIDMTIADRLEASTRLLIETTAGVVIYGSLLLLVKPDSYQHARTLLRNRRLGGTPTPPSSGDEGNGLGEP